MDCKTLLLLVIISHSVGCAANSENSQNSQFPNAPYIEKIGPGEIRYLNEVESFARKSRREDVYRKLSESCNGDFRIIKEGVRTKTGVIQRQGSIDDYPGARYVYIKYQCVL